MSNTLKLSLILLFVLNIILIIRRLKLQKLSIRYGVLWIILIIVLIISVVFSGLYFDLSKLLGFEKTSNMVFLFGFFFLFYLNFILLTTISVLNDKVKNLIQELSLLKERVEKNEKERK